MQVLSAQHIVTSVVMQDLLTVDFQAPISVRTAQYVYVSSKQRTGRVYESSMFVYCYKHTYINLWGLRKLRTC